MDNFCLECSNKLTLKNMMEGYDIYWCDNCYTSNIRVFLHSIKIFLPPSIIILANLKYRKYNISIFEGFISILDYDEELISVKKNFSSTQEIKQWVDRFLSLRVFI